MPRRPPAAPSTGRRSWAPECSELRDRLVAELALTAEQTGEGGRHLRRGAGPASPQLRGVADDERPKPRANASWRPAQPDRGAADAGAAGAYQQLRPRPAGARRRAGASTFRQRRRSRRPTTCAWASATAFRPNSSCRPARPKPPPVKEGAAVIVGVAAPGGRQPARAPPGGPRPPF